MNTQVAEIRRRVADGYHHCRVTQGLEDVMELLETVDKLVQSHWPCIKDEMTDDCVADIAEELGCANPTAP